MTSCNHGNHGQDYPWETNPQPSNNEDNEGQPEGRANNDDTTNEASGEVAEDRLPQLLLDPAAWSRMMNNRNLQNRQRFPGADFVR